MDEGLYPPRRKIMVQAMNENFFRSPRSINFQLTCNAKCISQTIITPCSNGMNTVTS